jgi:Fur family ferric uptake transcriptional regulator
MPGWDSLMQDTAEHILSYHALKVTRHRTHILQLFINCGGGLEYTDVLRLSGEKIDRVTLYRMLQLFLEKGIIHKIPSWDGITRYALGKLHEKGYHEQHLHFICVACGSITCLTNIPVPEIALPNGFVSQQKAMIINGTCEKCAGSVSLKVK